MTSRGLVEKDFAEVFQFVDRGVQIACKVKEAAPSKKMKDFVSELNSGKYPELQQLKDDVVSFAQSYPTVGFEEEDMVYKE